MDHATLSSLRDRHPAQRLLASPHAASFLMDRVTLVAHRPHWGEEPDPARHDVAHLTPEETAVYDDLRFDRHQPRLRLEQERVGFGWLTDQLRSGL